MEDFWNPSLHMPYDGKIIKQMPVLLSEGCIPISMRYGWQQWAGKTIAEIRNSFRGYSFCSGNPMVQDREGDIKAIKYRPGVNDKQYFDLLRLINDNAVLRDGAVVLPDGTYESLDAPVIIREELRRFTRGKAQTERQAVDNRVLRALAEDDVQLIRDCHRLFRELTGSAIVMPVYSDFIHDTETMRLWGVSYIMGGVYGISDLECAGGCLVGVAPEALVAAMGWPRESLETILKHLEEFRRAA